MSKNRMLRFLLPMMVAGLLIAVLSVAKCGPSLVDGGRKEEAKKPDLIRESGPQSLDKWIARFDRQVPPSVEPLADPSQTRGQLSNGLRYIVVENPENAGEVSLRLLVLSGSAHEGESEAGFAHFVEHMAFRTTAHRTDEGAMARFERLGLTSGADTNAHTARDHMLYRLDLPEADDSSLDEAFRFMRDVTDGMLFLPDEVEVEKAVVLREMDQRRYLTGFDARVALVLPEVPVAMASPIGKLETIESATPDSLRAFWERCYVPSRMVLVVVGDFTWDAMEAMIKRHFETLDKKDEVQEPELGDPLGGAAEPSAYSFRNDDQRNVRLALAVAQPIDRVPDDRAKRRDAMVRRLGLRMMTDRIADGCLDSRLAETGFACAEVELVPGIRWLEIAAETDLRPGSVFSAGRRFVVNWRQGLEYGFTELEFARAKRKIRGECLSRFSAGLSNSTSDLAVKFVDEVRRGRVVESPEDELNRSLVDLATITKAECESLMRVEWAASPLKLIVEGETTEETKSEVEEALASGFAATLSGARKEEEVKQWLPENPVSSGGEAWRKYDRERGVLEVQFDNRVLVRLKPMESLGGYVAMKVYLGHGKLSAPLSQPALVTATRFLTRGYPLEGWKESEFDAALALGELDHDFGIAEGRFMWSARTDRDHLGRQIDLISESIRRPGYAALDEAWIPSRQESYIEQLRQQSKDYQSSFREMKRLLNGDDPRFEWMPEGLVNTDSGQVCDWILPILRDDPLLVTIAGDFSVSDVLDDLSRTFGVMPERRFWGSAHSYRSVAEVAEDLRRVSFEKASTSSSFVMFPLGTSRDEGERLDRYILTRLLGLRLKELVREQMGLSYSPSVGFWEAPDKSQEWLVCYVPCASGRTDELGELMKDLVEEFRSEGWTEDELTRAVRPLHYSLARNERSPDVWVSRLESFEHLPGAGLTSVRSMMGREESLRALARRVLDVSRAVELRVEGSD